MAKQQTMELTDTVVTLQDYIEEQVRHKTMTEAKLAVMRDVSYAKKTVPQPGSGINYNFLSESELLLVLRPAMVHHGLTLRPVRYEQLTADSWNSKSGSVQHRCRLLGTFELTAALEGDKEATETVCAVGEGADTSDKAAGKAMTAAQKYALRQAFLMESGTDPDKHASQEVMSLASSMGKEKEEAYNRFVGALSVAESEEALNKLRASYRDRGFTEVHVHALNDLYDKTMSKIQAKGK